MTPPATADLSTPKPISFPDILGGEGQLQLDSLCPSREQLFSPRIARENGLNSDTFAILQIPNGSSLYDTLLLYASNFAVDLNAPALTQVDNAELSKKEVNSDKATATTAVDEASTAPSVDEASNAPAVDDAPTAPALDKKNNKGRTVKDEKPKPYVRGLNGVPILRREGPGHLSTLTNFPHDLGEPLDVSDSESTSDSDSDTSSEYDENNAFRSLLDIGVGCTGLGRGSGGELPYTEKASLGVLKKKRCCPLTRFHMGLGYAKVEVDGKTVFIHHCAYGVPLSIKFSESIRYFQTVVLAGEDDFQLKQLCAVAKKWEENRDKVDRRPRQGRFTLYRYKTLTEHRGAWCNQGNKLSRPVKSVILQDRQLDSIVNDIKEFVTTETKDWYAAHGIPHRRSFLFHGPPGSGKTSTIKLICGMFRFKACFLSLTASNFSNQVLQDALESLPTRCLLVLEDVDVLFNEDRKSETARSLTFSGLLNALDGLISVDGIVRIFTTNHIEKLDQALIRGGRVDRRFEFVHPNAKHLAKLFQTYYENASDELAMRFADTILSRPELEARSIATLQQHFICTRKLSPEESLEMIPQFFAEFYPKGGHTRNSLYV